MNENLLFCTLLALITGLTTPDIPTASIRELVQSLEDPQARLDTLEYYIRDRTYTNATEARSLINQYYAEASNPDLKAFQLQADYLLARFYLVRANYDSLDLLLQRSIPLARQNTDPYLLSEFMKLQGLRHYYVGDFAIGIQVFLTNIDLAKVVGENQLAAYFNNIGICYEKLQDYDAALTYYQLALEIDRRLPDNDYAIQVMINNISVIHLNRKDWQSAYALLQPICDTMYGPGLHNLHLDLAHAYARALFGLGQVDLALSVNREALDLALKVEDPQRIILHYLGLGDRFKEMGKCTQAIPSYQAALRYLRKHKIDEQKSTVYKALGYCHKEVGNFEEALECSELLSQIKDSIYNHEDITLARELDQKYQTSLKDQALLKSSLELTKKKRRNNVLTILLASILITVFFIYQNQQKSKQLDQQVLLLAEQHIADLEQQQKISNMSSMIEGQEAERRRIAKDLHDGLGGLLSTVKTKVAQIQRTMEELEDLELYQSTNDMIDQACDEVRRISSNMIPGLLRLEGLQGAIEELIAQWHFVYGIQVDATFDFESEQLSETQSHMLYRIIQEASNNMIKHSQASEVVLQLIEYEDHLNLLFEDNGVGFDVNQAQKGLGLQSISSRVNFLCGDLDISSSKKGTSINISIPT